MKADTDVISHKGNMDGEFVNLGFHKDSIIHLQSVLSSQYSDRALAVIREYSTNAWDSHRAAGNDDPILVTSPNPMNPNFIVQDFGVGMSKETLFTRFSQYGYSSKRNTNNEVGMFGIGCKCGLSYADQFSIIAVKDGIKTVAILSLDDKGAGQIKEAFSGETDEPDGVTITVPVKDVFEFNRKMTDFFKFWTPGSVLVDGNQPTFIGEHNGVIKVDDNLYIRPGDYTDDDIVVMGNVPYPTKKLFKGNASLVMFVEIGDVSFTPSRESLMDKPNTKLVLEFALDQVPGLITHKANVHINAAKNEGEAFSRAKKWMNAFQGIGKISYRGMKIPAQQRIPGYKWRIPDPKYRQWSNSFQTSLNPNYEYDDKAILVITGFTQNKVHSALKHGVIDYAQTLSPVPSHAFFCDVLGPWVQGIYKTVNIDTVYQKKAPVKSSPRAVTKDKYLLLTVHGTAKEVDELPPHDTIVILPQIKFKLNNNLSRIYRYIAKNSEKHIIVVVYKRSLDKFRRENENTILIEDYFQNEMKKSQKAATSLSFVVGHEHSHIETLKGLDDPRLIELQQARKQFKNRRELFSVGAGFVAPYPNGSITSGQAVIKELLKDYPFMKVASYAAPADMVEYFNVMYKHRKGPK